MDSGCTNEVSTVIEFSSPGTGFDPFYSPMILPALLTDPPQSPDERVLGPLAHHLWIHGRITEALTCLRLLKLRAPLGISHLLMQAYWELYLGRSARALDGFVAVLQQEPANESARLGYAYALFYLEDYSAAAHLFEDLARDAPHFNSPPEMAASSAALAQGKKPAEIKMAPLPGLPVGLSDAMQMQILRGPEAAIVHALSWIEKHPADALSLWRLVLELYLNLGHDQIAAQLAARLTKAHKNDGPLTYLSGVALRRIGKKEESHETFIKAAHMLAPLEARAWGGVAAGQVERGELDFAAVNYRIALFLDDSNPDYWGDLGQVELAEDRYQAAHHALGKAIKLGARSFVNYYYLGLSARGLGRDLEGIKDWALALQADPAHPKAKEILSLVANRTAQDPDQRFCFGDIREAT